MNWKVEFLNDVAEAEFSAMPNGVQASIARIISLILEHGLEKIGMPYVRKIEGKIWEIRGHWRDGIARSLYIAASGKRVIIVRSFVKKTRQTPREEILLALKRVKDVL